MLTFKRLQYVNLERATRWHKEGIESWSIADWAVASDLNASRVGIDLEAAVIKKFNFISERYNFPERL